MGLLGVYSFSSLRQYFEKQSDQSVGCFADTSILFSATYPADKFNEESELAFGFLAEKGISIFTNVNVRSEFLENHRRVLIAECLIDFLEDMEKSLTGELLEKLKSHRTLHRKKVGEEKNTKLDTNQLKAFRLLFSNWESGSGNGWELFCRNYLHKKLVPLWKDVEAEFGLNYLSTRSGAPNAYMQQAVDWENAVDLMGKYGIGSADAMIANIFLCSTIPVLLTADSEMVRCVSQESAGKKAVFVPDSHGGIL